MENLNNSEVQPPEVSESGSVNKRVATPVLTFAEAFAFVDNINKQLGAHTFHKNQAIADASGLALPTIRQTLSTCQQYGLLELKHGVGYKPTALFESILFPKNDNEKRNLGIQSLRCSWILNSLIELFEGKQVPVLTGIQNTIVRDMGVKEVDKAGKIASIFVDNLKNFKLIDEKGILVTSDLQEKPAVIPPVDKPDVGKADKTKDQIDLEDIEIKIPLKGQAKDAILVLPRDYKDADLVRIIKFVDALKNDELT